MRGSAANFLALVAAWVVIFVGFSIAKPDSFPSLQNVETIARQTVPVAFAAIGVTFVIISGAIDLSVGSAVALVTVVIGWLLRAGFNPVFAAAAGIGVGFLCGLVNGTLVTRLRVGSFIVTLGNFLVFRGIAKGLAGEKKIDAPMSGLNDLLASLARDDRWMVFPPGVWLLLASAAIATVLVRMTPFGRRVVAVGSNERAAALSGVSVAAIRTWVFLCAGVCSGVAGVMQFSRLSVGDPTTAVSMELEAIAAAVLGGASLAGGIGSIPGTLVGAFVMGTVRAGCSQTGLPNWVQEMVTGAIIILAVALDGMRLAKSRRDG